MGSDRAWRVPQQIAGLEHLEAARGAGRGVLLVGAHFAHLELCVRWCRGAFPSPACTAPWIRRCSTGRVARVQRYAAAMFTKEELRATVKYIKAGGIVAVRARPGHAGKDSVFAFLLRRPRRHHHRHHHLARACPARWCCQPSTAACRRAATLRLGAPLADFPGTDAAADTARVNAQIEAMVREAPAQYLWLHKAGFQDAPPGAAPVY